MLGNYYGTPRHLITPLAGIQQEIRRQNQVRWALGSVYANSTTALVPSSALTPWRASGENGVLAEYFKNTDFSGEPVLEARRTARLFCLGHARSCCDASLARSHVRRALEFFACSVPITGEYQLGLGRQECDSCLGTNTWRLTLDGEKLVEDSRRAAGGHRTFTKTDSSRSGQVVSQRAPNMCSRKAALASSWFGRRLPMRRLPRPWKRPNKADLSHPLRWSRTRGSKPKNPPRRFQVSRMATAPISICPNRKRNY